MVHREFYRLPESCTQVTNISKLLLAAEGESMAKHRGKCLNQLGATSADERNQEAGPKEQDAPREDDEKNEQENLGSQDLLQGRQKEASPRPPSVGIVCRGWERTGPGA